MSMQVYAYQYSDAPIFHDALCNASPTYPNWYVWIFDYQ